ncbi:MAG: 30S ribosomal protein S2 [Candidatus Bathyarchaeota archaeon]
MAAETYSYLLPLDSLMSSGIQIGTRIKTKDMAPFIYRVRPDGLFIIDTRKTDERIKIAAKFLATFQPDRVLVTSSRLYGHQPVLKFCELTGTIPLTGSFPPGALTNPLCPSYIEPQVVFVTDPSVDEQALNEASRVGLPVVALCDTDNILKDTDLIVPTNNKGRKALAMIYWLMAKQYSIERGIIPPDGDISTPVEDFEAKLIAEKAEPEL